ASAPRLHSGSEFSLVPPRRLFVTASLLFGPRNRSVCAERRSLRVYTMERSSIRLRRANMKRAMWVVAVAALCVAGSAVAEDRGGLIGSGTRTEDSGQTVGSGGFTTSTQDEGG